MIDLPILVPVWEERLHVLCLFHIGARSILLQKLFALFEELKKS